MSKETPDEMARFNRTCHLDKTEHGVVGHDMASIIHGATDIKRSPPGKQSRLDATEDAESKSMRTNAEPGLGAGGGRLGDAVSSIKSGARAPKADMSALRKG